MASAALEKLEEARESVFFPSCGPQAEGTKKSLPVWTLPKSGRDDVKKVFISKKHPQDLLGKDSPGHVYEPKRQRSLPKWGFGTADARPPIGGPRFPESSNDLTCALPDSQQFKYGSKTVAIGNCPRDVITNAPDLKGFPIGAISPGPMRYNLSNCPPAVRLAHAPDADKIPPKYTMRPKTKILELESQTGEKVGPGIYPVPEACGTQASSVKKSLPIWSCCKIDRFPKKINQADSGRLWDGEGKKKVQFNRNFSAPPSFSFGTSTRFHAQKLAPALTPLDKAGACKEEPPKLTVPSLPPRREAMKYTDVPSGG
eukprot:TRINITY_DN90644_c0_g1_i1.p1 TRINITY_DN90644_c0_g1~~TRINITY_DN90644_c0_g1_i1.p1  ORF type:complete len:314 (-),score=50.88 TRINITY_DN90644_c0_g1_i1:52-993(-)